MADSVANFEGLIKERSERILQRFGQVILSDVREPKLKAALEDVKKYWGDINRPSLTFFSCEAVGGDWEAAESAALMFTLASCGFGVHDDIIDKSANKHLRRTLLGIHGLDTALLVGDLLIFKGLTVVHEMIIKSAAPLKIADALKVYGRLSVEICEAEMQETLCQKNLDTDVDYFKEVLWKEMAETEACCRIGAMLGNGEPEGVEALADFGRRIGFISRLTNEVEDCLNLKGDLAHRIKFESIPLPLLYAAKSPGLNGKLKEIILKRNLRPVDARFLLSACFESEAFEYVRGLAEKNRAEATQKLSCLKSSKARDVLIYLIDRAYSRIDELCI